MKVIFLDFDGVITTKDSKWKLCPEKMAMLGDIIAATDAKIVISSSWRRTNLEDTISHITNPENPYVGENPFPYANRVIGITPRMFGFIHPHKDRHCKIPRGVEINAWIWQHLQEIDNYVILDDELDMLYTQRNHFVQTHPIFGLDRNEVDKAIIILNKIPFDNGDI